MPPPALDPAVLPLSDRLIDKTARVEGGGRYDAINPDDRGAGISFGLIQFNQRRGSLPALLRALHERDPARFAAIFDPDGPDLLNETWVRAADLATPAWRSRFVAAGAHPPFQQVQRELARREYLDPAARVAAELGLTSERALAMVFDAAVQLGVGGMTRKLREAAAGGGSTREILTRFAAIADDVAGGHRRRTNLLHDATLGD